MLCLRKNTYNGVFAGQDAQREATHFKNRVLDLVDTFIKRQPANPLIIPFVVPLIGLASDSSQDEKQLSDKALGILRSRFAKPKEIPTGADTDTVNEALSAVHERARRNHPSTITSVLSQCSLYLAKVLSAEGAEPKVVEAYAQSLEDFVSRKGSHLNSSFFLDFLRRSPTGSWAIRDRVINLVDKSINVYRRVQVFQLLQCIVQQMSVLVSFSRVF